MEYLKAAYFSEIFKFLFLKTMKKCVFFFFREKLFCLLLYTHAGHMFRNKIAPNKLV